MQNFIPLVVVKDGPSINQDLDMQTPVVKVLPGDAIEEVHQATFGSVLKMSKSGNAREVRVLESPLEVKAAENPLSTDLHVQNAIDAAISATGTAQGDGYDVTKYFNNVTTATATSAEALDLPAALQGGVHCIKNATAVALEIYPASGETIDGAAADAVKAVAAFSTVYFACVVDGEWVTTALT